MVARSLCYDRARMTVTLRGLKASDLGPIERILRANAPVFSEAEIATAVAMLEHGLSPGSQDAEDAYRFLVAETAGEVHGYALFARAALTQGTWDLYWIATDPAGHGRGGRGVGRALLKGVEDAVRSAGGRLILIETSSRHDYAKARRFYEAAGYARAATLTDYYRDGDDKVIFARRVDEKPA
jgi:ribosomal protein S18 acetylase RimI-like enzyme